MVEIRLTNTKTRRKEVFTPIDPHNVRMYVCGPTVYDRAHLGNARPVVVFDVLYRLLRHVYGADHVTYVRNFTDVDDKINARAAETGRDIRAITDETIRWYHEDMDALGALRPTKEPRATEWIGAMIAMIEELLAKGHAYVAEGHALFRVRSYADYGKLSGRSVDDMIAGARVEVAPYKEDPLDFVLWKPSSDDLPGWDSPWGRGRPGWHIECSAMSRELLGAHFDIHGGGLDLQFPHHENEIAQSCCADPDAGFANVWMHNEMLQVEGRKMSKSLGNFFTVRDLLDGNDVLGKVSPEVIRASLLYSHYRSPTDFSVRRRHDASLFVVRMAKALGRTGVAALEEIGWAQPFEEVVEALADDLNTPLAMSALISMSERLPTDPGARTIFFNRLHSSLDLLGFDLRGHQSALDQAKASDELRGVVARSFQSVSDLERLALQIDQARRNKDFAKADRLRAGAIAAGVEVQTGPSGTTLLRLPDFDAAAMSALLE